MSESEQLRRIRLDAAWDAFKRRYSVASFVDDDSQPIDEASLSDDDKWAILARYSGRPPVTLIDLTPDRRPVVSQSGRLRALLRRLRGKG